MVQNIQRGENWEACNTCPAWTILHFFLLPFVLRVCNLWTWQYVLRGSFTCLHHTNVTHIQLVHTNVCLGTTRLCVCVCLCAFAARGIKPCPAPVDTLIFAGFECNKESLAYKSVSRWSSTATVLCHCSITHHSRCLRLPLIH